MTHQEMLQAESEAVYFKKYIDNIQIVPTTALVAIYNSAGEVLVDETACTISADGTMSYTLAEEDTANLGENYRARFDYEYDSESYTSVVYFDIVKKRLESIITDDDLIDEHSMLNRYGYRETGEVVTSGGVNQIIDNKSFKKEDNYFRGGFISFLSGNNKGFNSIVTSFTASTGRFTLEKSATAAFAAGDKFCVSKSYTTEIRRAFEKIKDYIRSQGNRPALVIDDTDIRELHIVWSLMLILLGMGDDKRDEYEEYKSERDRLMASLVLKYDTNEDGVIQEDEAPVNFGTVRLRR
jgi:hypothetical protein